ncbi:hypothetical protein D9619_000402 [Psilocybe cf. subviscida]|uniref:Uncharacterized protein n=1 Tax=Psilocybe cf. subviscida TaxID=2480587 RepID=A0A8H5BDW5_9AGAR|nr:hypothetical protein D9619_000402 [Psilocybe cf. subviscida]
MSASTAPLELLQAVDRSFQDIIVEGFFAGIYAAAFIVTIFGLSRRLEDGRSTIYLLLVTILMFCLSYIHFGAHWYFARIAYVWDNTGPEGVVNALHSQTFAGQMTGSVAFAANIFIADCLFIWRCWVIWDQDWRVVALPILTTVAATIFSGLNLAAEGGVLSPTFIDTSTSFLALSVVTTLLVTVLITYRIYSVAADLRKQGGGGFGGYFSAVEIIVESALLNSIALLALLILVRRMDDNYVYAQNIVAQVSGLAPTLIIARISLGLARPNDTWNNTGRGTHVGTSLVFSSAAGRSNTLHNMSADDAEDVEKQAVGSSASPSLAR